MRSTCAVAVLVGVAFVGWAPTVLAQGTQESQLVQIIEYFVEPGGAAGFEEARRSQVEVWGEHGLDYGGQMSVTDGFVYREVRILGDWEDFERRQQQVAAMPRNGLPTTPGAHHHRRHSILRTHPNLSYAPEDPREGVTIGDVGFIHYVFLHLRPGTRAAALDLVRQGTAMLREHGIRDNVIVTSTVVAADAPFVLFRFHAKDQQAYYANWAENEDILGEEFASIRRQLGALARHIEVADHTVRRDLSYQPPAGALGASRDPFVGTWRLNVAESSYSPGSAPREI